MRTRSLYAERGLTVLELVIVMAVLALLTAIVIPSSSMSDKRKLDTLQVELQDAIDHARSLAYHKGIEHGVVFHVAKDYFAVVNRLGTPVDDPLSHGDYVVKLSHPGQPKGLDLVSAAFPLRPTVGFNEKGVLATPGEMLIRAGETTRRLVIDSATARLTEVPIEAP